MDELMQAAGDWPGKQEPKLDPIRAADIAPHGAQLEAVKNDNYATRTDAIGAAVAADRKFTPAELGALDTDDLFALAGGFPK
jgi:hypothetical protein